MEVRGENGLICEPKVSDIDSLYIEMDNTDSGIPKPSRPSSAASFASWTFSPIVEEESDYQESQCTTNNEHLPDNQQIYDIVNQPTSSQTNSQPTTNSNQQHLQQMNNTSSEYYIPNPITYHHSVNIHNYVGNYCVGPSLWKESCMWEGIGPQTFPAFSDSYQEQNPTQILKVADQGDPLAALNVPGLEFTRCSTPEYVMALNSLQQMDSPPRPNHSAAMNFSCAASFEESAKLNSSGKQQDSGYNSDLNISPVIQYQDAQAKADERDQSTKRQTSTPNSYQPYLTIAPMQLFNKENVMSNSHQNSNFPHRFSAGIQGFRPKHLCGHKPSHFTTTHLGFPAGFQPLLPLKHHVNSNRSAEYHKLLSGNKISGPKFTSVADYQLAKKKEAQLKTKQKLAAKPALKLKEELNESEKLANEAAEAVARRRRHNEPLNNLALGVMSEWYQTHKENPYPTKSEKEELARAGGITLAQVKSWFANKRNRNNNTRPKKQKIEMEERLLEICHQLARDARKPNKDNAYYIQQLSSIIDTTKINPGS